MVSMSDLGHLKVCSQRAGEGRSLGIDANTVPYNFEFWHEYTRFCRKLHCSLTRRVLPDTTDSSSMRINSLNVVFGIWVPKGMLRKGVALALWADAGVVPEAKQVLAAACVANGRVRIEDVVFVLLK